MFAFALIFLTAHIVYFFCALLIAINTISRIKCLWQVSGFEHRVETSTTSLANTEPPIHCIATIKTSGHNLTSYNLYLGLPKHFNIQKSGLGGRDASHRTW